MHELSLDQAYKACREIARREAKNFYYAFLALPAARRNAICAIYAFMRQADDLADDESFSHQERRQRLNAWMNEWRGVCRGGISSNPAFVGAHDAVHRFGIPLQLLDELVAGVSMDLDRAPHGGPDTYSNFDDLYHYCYLVASVVGLVSIHIFGYADPCAEKLAEETGIAFQLTNILRDVPEDAERNRVYLPIEDLLAHGLSVTAILRRQPKAPPSVAERALLAEYARRAENYYRSAEALLPLIAPESRPALWVLVTIYHALLKRIEQANFNVFTRRASVPTPQKFAILIIGLARMTWARAFG
jgi:phytoene synthase